MLYDVNEEFTFILDENEFRVQFKICCLNNINKEIRRYLIKYKKYEVQSKVSKTIFESFIDFWINKKIPSLDSENIEEYKKLSQEFGIMADLIDLFILKQNKIEESNEYNQIIEDLGKKYIFHDNDPISKCEKTFMIALKDKDFEYIKSFSHKKIQQDGFIFALDNDNYTAIILKYFDDKVDILIPYSVFDNSNEYIVTQISDYSFYELNINSIKFPENSKN